MKKFVLATGLALSLSITLCGTARAHNGPSEASAGLSMLPIAISVAVPVAVVSLTGAFVVTAVQGVSGATVWVLERASDGAQASVKVSAQVAGGASVVVGTAVVVTACSAGWVLSTAGKAIAFVPNEIGKALLHNERVTR